LRLKLIFSAFHTHATCAYRRGTAEAGFSVIH
jgi:hypothetical protein